MSARQEHRKRVARVTSIVTRDLPEAPAADIQRLIASAIDALEDVDTSKSRWESAESSYQEKKSAARQMIARLEHDKDILISRAPPKKRRTLSNLLSTFCSYLENSIY